MVEINNIVQFTPKHRRATRPVYVFEDTIENYRELMRLYISYRLCCRVRRGPVRIGLDKVQIQKGEIVMEPFNSEVLAALAALPDGRLLQVETIDAKR